MSLLENSVGGWGRDSYLETKAKCEWRLVHRLANTWTWSLSQHRNMRQSIANPRCLKLGVLSHHTTSIQISLGCARGFCALIYSCTQHYDISGTQAYCVSPLARKLGLRTFVSTSRPSHHLWLTEVRLPLVNSRGSVILWNFCSSMKISSACQQNHSQ